ncbi:hypothetical protein H4R33_005966 [Dimargaris cristalligena]|nr:hypothetical protein H4R33_005966 [Dimargaris cristalligena]
MFAPKWALTIWSLVGIVLVQLNPITAQQTVDDLPTEVVGLVLNNVKTFEDQLTASQVSPTWKAIITQERIRRNQKAFDYLMKMDEKQLTSPLVESQADEAYKQLFPLVEGYIRPILVNNLLMQGLWNLRYDALGQVRKLGRPPSRTILDNSDFQATLEAFRPSLKTLRDHQTHAVILHTLDDTMLQAFYPLVYLAQQGPPNNDYYDDDDGKEAWVWAGKREIKEKVRAGETSGEAVIPEDGLVIANIERAIWAASAFFSGDSFVEALLCHLGDWLPATYVGMITIIQEQPMAHHPIRRAPHLASLAERRRRIMVQYLADGLTEVLTTSMIFGATIKPQIRPMWLRQIRLAVWGHPAWSSSDQILTMVVAAQYGNITVAQWLWPFMALFRRPILAKVRYCCQSFGWQPVGQWLDTKSVIWPSSVDHDCDVVFNQYRIVHLNSAGQLAVRVYQI